MPTTFDIFKKIKPGFENELFTSTKSALHLTKGILKELRGKVHAKDRKYIALVPLEKHWFPDSEFKLTGRFKRFYQRQNQEDCTFRGKSAHLFTSMRQEMPLHLQKLLNEILNIIEKEINNSKIKRKLNNLIMTLWKSTSFSSAAEDLWELLIALDTLMQSGVERITLYYCYQIGQRQHKRRIHEAFTAALVLRLAQLAAGGAHVLRNICIIHPHNETSPGFLQGTKVDDLLPIAPAVLYFQNNPKTKGRKIVPVALDAGSEFFNRCIANAMGVEGPVVLNKDRDDDGNPTSFVAKGQQFICDGAIYLACDDLVSSAETLENAKRDIERLTGHPIDFYAYATHGCLNEKKDKQTKKMLSAEDRLRRENIHLITSNTIFRSDEYLKTNSDVITMYDLSPYLADAVICNVLGKSMGTIFQRHIEAARKGEPSLNSLLLNNKIAA